jgi:hypothetical protein
MKCTSCDSENLSAIVRIELGAPLAAKGGTLKVSGVKLTQLDIKAAWDSGNGSGDARIRGPIICQQCYTEHVYVVGLRNPLLAISLADAVAAGYDALAG